MNNTTNLHLNELPFAPTPTVLKEIETTIASSNRYPEWDGITLRGALGSHYGFDPSWVVVAGTGSIGLIQQAMVASGRGEIAYSWPSFEAFDIAAKALHMPIKHLPLKDYACDLTALAQAITPQTNMVIVCTPNAPTGGVVGHDEFIAFMKKVPNHVLVLLDEAYGEFTDDTDTVDGLSLVREYSNLLVTRTFSKAYGLAGIRVGYGIAQPELAARIANAGLPFPASLPFQAAALRALADQKRLKQNVQAINTERARLATELRKLGAEVVEGYGNFVWLPLQKEAEKVIEHLKREQVFVKNVISHGIRITVGTPADTDAVCTAWRKITMNQQTSKL